MLASILVNAFSAPGRVPSKPADFMLSKTSAAPRQQTVEEMQQRFRTAFKLMTPSMERTRPRVP